MFSIDDCFNVEHIRNELIEELKKKDIRKKKLMKLLKYVIQLIMIIKYHILQ